MNVLTLYDPAFWKKFFEDMPSGGARDVEEEALAAAAASAGVSFAYAMARLQDYLSGRLEEKLQNPFAPDDPHQHRGTSTVH
jgi:hypothetical protein